MKVSFFRSIRGKMAASYTLVTVFIIVMVLTLLAGFLFIDNYDRFDTNGYISDIASTFLARASVFYNYERAEFDIPEIQSLLEDYHNLGGIPLPSWTFINTSQAALVESMPLFILDKDKKVVASTSDKPGYRVGESYQPASDASSEADLIHIILSAEDQTQYLPSSITRNFNDIEIFIPIGENVDSVRSMRYLAVFTVQAPPPFSLRPLLRYLPLVGVILVLLIVLITPIGVIFGLITGRGLTKRIRRLATASSQLAEGQFEAILPDHSKDELGQLNRQMRVMSERLQTLMQNQHELAAIQERTHLARELHDTVKQQNFATQMQIRAARNLISSNPDQASAKLREAESILKSSQEELGNIIHELRPAQLQDCGLTKALRETIRRWCNRNQIPVELNIAGERRIALAHEEALLRVAQEGLSNISRHARATMVWIRLDYQADKVILTMRDNGVGFSRKTLSVGMGLQNMQSRVEALGGWFGTSSAPGKGTQLVAYLPLKELG